jgi:hypothetical protein
MRNIHNEHNVTAKIIIVLISFFGPGDTSCRYQAPHVEGTTEEAVADSVEWNMVRTDLLVYYLNYKILLSFYEVMSF